MTKPKFACKSLLKKSPLQFCFFLPLRESPGLMIGLPPMGGLALLPTTPPGDQPLDLRPR